MFIHLGGDTVVRQRAILAIFDLRVTGAPASHYFLGAARRAGRLVALSDSQAKSMVVTDAAVYLSPISAATLKKRADFLREKEEPTVVRPANA